MNFKRYHVSRNLFDKTAEYVVGTTTYNYTISGLDPSKYYTCSTNFERISGVNTASLYFNGSSSNSNGVWSDTPKTFKPNSSGEIIVYLRYRGSAGAPEIYNGVMAGTIWVMVNEGSTALPYEPYSSEVWHDIPHYIHKTDTDTITTLPADIYANDNNATIDLKGNMSQSGTPTPTSSIQPQECGDLETEGEHTGQYKIPISSGGVTTPVYLGEVQSTRRIKKLVLTGQENWEVFPVGTGRYFRYMISSTVTAIANVGICSHYNQDNIGTSTINTDIFTINAPSAGGNGVVISPSDVTLDTAADFKAYLAQQYAAGTPVCVWYVLATPETGIVNEPIRKIDTYADEVSGITIPVTAGANTLSIGTTLQPSEVSVTYHGWHPVQSVHERKNGQWD